MQTAKKGACRKSWRVTVIYDKTDENRNIATRSIIESESGHLWRESSSKITKEKTNLKEGIT